MNKNVALLFDKLWDQYLAVTPSAQKIHQLLAADDEIINDHIALRTFNLPEVGLAVLAKPFLELGYEEKGQYEFKQKKLNAKHFEHPDPDAPKVFISELLVDAFSDDVQNEIKNMVAQVDKDLLSGDAIVTAGRPWACDYGLYQKLIAESEYAGWMAAFGYRANHFTVNVNRLTQYDTLEQVNEALKAAGYILNTSGGEIKGSAEVCLEQSSTMADKVRVTFDDGEFDIASCFYEFARRHPLPNGELYTGFVAASADKIFESTNSE